jgi:transposase
MTRKLRVRSLRVTAQTGLADSSTHPATSVLQTGPKEVRFEDLKAVLERARAAALNEADLTQLGAAVDTLAVLTAELAAKGATVLRLRSLLFGPKSEKTARVLARLIGNEPAAGSDGTLGTAGQVDSSDTTGTASTTPPGAEPADPEPRPKPKGHGRNGADAYRGAKKVKVHHDSLVHGIVRAAARGRCICSLTPRSWCG